MKRSSWKKILEGIGIAVIGFALFNVAFMIYAAILGLIALVAPSLGQNHPLGFVLFILVLSVLGILVYRSKLSTGLKAGYLCMPVMSILVMFGILFYQNQILVFGLSGLFIGVLLGLLWIKHQPWQYFFSILYCSALGVMIALFKVQI